MKIQDQFNLHPEYESITTARAPEKLEVDEIFAFVPEKYDSSHDVLVGTTTFNGESYRVVIHDDQIDVSDKKSVAISKVGKTIFAVITRVITDKNKIIASRKLVQDKYLLHISQQWEVDSVIDGVVTNTSNTHGVFVDIGYGVPSLIHKANLCNSRLSAEDLLIEEGQYIGLVYKGTSGNQVRVSHKELLGQWQDIINDMELRKGISVVGKVTSVQDYGIFVALHPNLSGLAPAKEGINEGDYVTTYIDRVVPSVQKVVLTIIDTVEEHEVPRDIFKPTKYTFTQSI